MRTFAQLLRHITEYTLFYGDNRTFMRENISSESLDVN